MKTATVKIYIDKSHPRMDGNSSISIRVTYNRSKRYYPTGIVMLPEKFYKLMAQKRKSEADKLLYSKIHMFYERALAITSKMDVFTFSNFEDRFLTNRDATNSLFSGFNDYIQLLEKENKINTSISYRCAQRSLQSFKSNLTYADITTDFLRGYAAWMQEKGKSDATIGIYLRCLRAILNRAKIDQSIYPFGRGRGKFTIQSGRNFKKSLNSEEIIKIFNYLPEKIQEQKARDYWIFLYLCNGMNVKDFCNLKWSNYSVDAITFIREKSRRSRQDNLPVIVSVKPEVRDIISKWGVPSVNQDSYIFPHLRNNISPRESHLIVQQLTKLINKYMRRISQNLNIQKVVTTYCARHSYATILKNSGVSIEFISESLNHSSVKTTKNYLASFDLEQIHQATESLRVFAGK